MTLLRTAVFALAASFAATAAHAQVAFRSAATAVQAATPFATITYVAGATAQGQGNNVNLTLPAAAQTGDVVITLVAVEDETNASVTKPGTMTQIRGDNAGNHVQITSYRVITGADTPGTTTYNWSWTGTEDYAASILVFRNVDTSAPIDASNGTPTNATNTTTVNIPAVTPTVANTLLVLAVSIRSGSTFGTWSGGATERTDSRSNAGGDEVGAATATDPGPAAGVSSGAYTVTASDNDTSRVGVLLALRPAIAPAFTINVPAGTAAGDVMLASIVVRPSSVIITPPTGWSAQAATVQNSGNSTRHQVFYRVSPGGEPASYTWTVDSAHAGAAGAIASYSGVDTTTPIDAFGGNTTPSGLGHTANAVVTTVVDTMVVSTHAFGSAATWTSAGVNERVDIASQAAGNNGVALSFYDATQAAAGSTGNRTATASGNADFGSAHFIALRPFVPQPVLAWSLNQLSWNGTAGEVLDLSGNGLHGTSSGGANTSSVTPALAGNPGSCQYGVFDGNDDFAQVADNALLDVTDELTVMMWLRPTAYPTAGNLKSFVSKDQNYEAHLTSTGAINWWWGGGALELTSAGTVPLNQWTHVALVYSRAGAFQRIYRDGVLDANTNNQAGALVPNNMPFQIAADQGFAGRNFAGWIDEVYVFRSALSATRIAQYMNTTRPCVGAVDHFAISHAGSGVGCMDHQITITAHSSTHTAVDANALAVNLSTSHGKGTWTGVFAGGGTLNDVTAGDGAATYSFAAGSNSVTLLFRNASIAGTSETFSFNVSGGGYSEATGTANVSDDPSFTMYGAGFRFRNITDAVDAVPTQISGKPSDTGWNAKTIRLQAINTDTVSGSCTNLFASQVQNVELGAECNNPTACSAGPALPVSINGGDIATSNDNAGAGATAYTSVALNFNANSEADTVIAYPNAGSVSLHARYDLNGAVAGFEMQGSSNAFVVRPFGLAFPGVAHNSTAGGALLAAAGDPFSMTLTAYRWASGEDANNDGIPDAGVNITNNGTTPNFAATATVGVQAGGNLPGVADGAISRGAACAQPPSVVLAGGTVTDATWCYSEVGNVLLTAAVTDYLGATDADIAGNSGLDGDAGGGYVGRFRPKHFTVTGTPALTNRSSLTCPGSTFTYMGEQLSLAFSLEARNTQNALTQNYTGAYAKLALGTAGSLGIGALSGATSLTARVDSSLAPTGSFSNGAASLVVPTAIRRASPDAPDGPRTATQFGIAANDGEGVVMDSFDMDAEAPAGNERKSLGVSTELRFGRLRLQNGYAPDNVGVRVPLDIQYWNNGGFALNTADSCTSLARDNIALSFAGVVAACNTAVSEASITFASGLAALTLLAPGAGNTGTVTLTPNLGTAGGVYCPAKGVPSAAATASPAGYLLGRWDDAANPDGDASTSYDDKPTGRATFGLYGSQPKNFIFFRENY